MNQQWLVDSSHKFPAMWSASPCHDVVMQCPISIKTSHPIWPQGIGPVLVWRWSEFYGNTWQVKGQLGFVSADGDDKTEEKLLRWASTGTTQNQYDLSIAHLSIIIKSHIQLEIQKHIQPSEFLNQQKHIQPSEFLNHQNSLINNRVIFFKM